MPIWSICASLAKQQFGLLATVATFVASSGVSMGLPTPRSSDWPGYGLNASEQRFSPASQIDTSNVADLKLAYYLDLPHEGALEATPLEIQGVVYFPGSMGVVYAVDAVSGKLKWTFDPKAGPRIDHHQRMIYPVNRGLAYFDHKVYVATRDGRLIALNSVNGVEVWTSRFLTAGDHSTSTGAPRIAKGMVLIGNSGAEANARGYVTALDANTGKIAWRFFTVPGNPAKGFENDAMRMAAATWSGEWWKLGGGGTPWNSIVYDAAFDQVLIGAGNGSPYVGRLRGTTEGKENLFLASVVAVDAGTGRYKWHYQYNPGEVWDYKATMDIILADLTINGTAKQVLLQSPSNGFFYVIDRSNGKLLSAEKTGKVSWADRIDLKTGRPVENPAARYENGPFILYPSVLGTHDWQAMAYSPKTQLAYIPYMQTASKFWHSKDEEQLLYTRAPGWWNTGVMFESYVDPADPMDGRGSLLAWDPVAQKVRWRQDYPTFWNGGILTTEGNLVFQGIETGEFAAYDAGTGKKLWSFDAQMGIVGAPISFVVDNKQYVSVLAGFGGSGGDGCCADKKIWSYQAPRRLLTFALGGSAMLPKPDPALVVTADSILDDPNLRLDNKQVAKGEYLWGFSCGTCHGVEGRSLGAAPDLRASHAALDKPSFTAILRKNLLVDTGMPRFDDLKDEQLDGLYQYIRSVARKAKAGAMPSDHRVDGPGSTH
jgi:quinohemoprotein ethanol dehydrogenase